MSGQNGGDKTSDRSGGSEMAMLELEQCNVMVVVKYDYDATDSTKLTLRRGDMVLVQQKAPTGWWHGVCNDRRGWFPSNFVDLAGTNGLVMLPSEQSAGPTTGNSSAGIEPESIHSTHIQCLTDDGRTYYVNKMTGQTVWENELTADVIFTDNHNRYNPPNSAMLSNSINSAYDTRSISSSGQSRLNVEITSESSSILPPGWSKVDTPDGQAVYLNAATAEMQFHPPDLEQTAYAKLSMPQRQEGQNEDEWPTNWSQKTLADGRVFYFNFMTDECAWSLSEVSPTGELLTPLTPIVDEISAPLEALTKISLPAGSLTWGKLSEGVHAFSEKIGAAVQDCDKVKTFHYVNSLVEVVRSFLFACRTLDGEPEARKKLRIANTKVATAIKKTLHASSIACMVWSPPNAFQALEGSMAHLLTTITDFIIIGIEGGFAVSEDEYAQGKFVMSGIKQSNVSNLEILLEMKQRCMTLTDMITDLVKDVLTKVYAYNETDLLEGIRVVTAKMGDISSIVDDHLPTNVISAETTTELRDKKQQFFNCLSQVMSALSIAANPLAPSNAAIDVAAAAKECYSSCTDLLICVKFAIQEKESYEDVGFINDVTDDTSSVHSGSHVRSEPVAEVPKSGYSFSLFPKRNSSLENGAGTGRKSRAGGNLEASMAGFQDALSSTSSPSLKSKKLGAISETDLDAGTLEFQATVSAPMSPKIRAGETPGVPRLNIPKPKEKKKDDSNMNSGGSGGPSTSKSEKPWYLRYDPPETRIVFNADGAVKGGTIDALVERLTLHDSNDPSFVQSFLLTYRSFTTTHEFHMLLQKRYMIEPPSGLNFLEMDDWNKHCRDLVRLRVFNVMKTWVENYCYENDEDRNALKLMKTFADTVMMEGTPNTAFQLSNLVDRRTEFGVHMRVRTTQYNTTEFPQPIWPWNPKRITLLEINPLEAARQLTLMESAMYNRIHPVECLKKAWSNKTDPTVALNVKGMIKMSNQIAGWVVRTILTEPDVKKRAALLKHFVTIAEKCRALNNFCTLNTILGALNSASIHRLKKTWPLIGKHVSSFKSLCDLMSLDKNFAKYRETIQSANPPCLPYFGLCLTDLTFVEDGSADTLKPREKVYFPGQFVEDEVTAAPTVEAPPLINFYKHIKTAEIIRSIQQFQNEPYHLAVVRDIQEYFYASFESDIDDRELFALSLEVEPRDRDNEKMARAIMDAGMIEKGIAALGMAQTQ